jgi:hypothetical protein
MRDNTMALAGWACLTNANIFGLAPESTANTFSGVVFLVLMCVCWGVDFYDRRVMK